MTTAVTYIPWTPSIDTVLPDVEGAWIDVLGARKYAQRLLEILRRRDEAMIDAELLCIGALVKYFRSFGSGRRAFCLHPDQLSPPLTLDLLAAHTRLKKIRDAHVVHPVNRYEVSHVVVGVADHDDFSEVTCISCGTTSFNGLSIDEATQFVALCDIWLAHLNERRGALQADLLAAARQVSIDDIRRAAADVPVQPDADPFVDRQSARRHRRGSRP